MDKRNLTSARLLLALYFPYANSGSPIEGGIGFWVGVLLLVYSALILLSRIHRFRSGIAVTALVVVTLERRESGFEKVLLAHLVGRHDLRFEG